jgi:hypothetical protein
MSHHYSGPDFAFPHGDARLDLTDLYAFPKPSEADKLVLVMNVHPSAVVNPPGPTTRKPFAPEALYELKIDTNGDAVAEIAYRVRFSSSADGYFHRDPRTVTADEAARQCPLPAQFGRLRDYIEPAAAATRVLISIKSASRVSFGRPWTKVISRIIRSSVKRIPTNEGVWRNRFFGNSNISATLP